MVLFERAHHWLDRLTTLPGLRQACAIRYERRFAGNRRENLFRGVYDSFEAAAATAPAARPLGYDNPDSALMYRDRIQRVYPSDYPVLFWLQWLFAQGCTHVFELGGHIGISYYAYQTVMSYPDALRWVVSDVPAVMERGTAFARNKDGLGKLSFDGDFSHAAEADVLMALGVLQYLPETLAQRLAGLPRLPPHLIVNLTPLHAERGYFTLQSIGTAFCPYRIDVLQRFIDGFKALGYTVRDAWINPEKSCEIPFHPQHSLRHYHGFYLRRDDADGVSSARNRLDR